MRRFLEAAGIVKKTPIQLDILLEEELVSRRDAQADPTGVDRQVVVTAPQSSNKRRNVVVGGLMATTAAVTYFFIPALIKYFNSDSQPKSAECTERTVSVYFGDSTFNNFSEHARPGGAMILPLVAKWTCAELWNSEAAQFSIQSLWTLFALAGLCGDNINSVMALHACVEGIVGTAVEAMLSACNDTNNKTGRFYSDYDPSTLVVAPVNGSNVTFFNTSTGAPALELAMNVSDEPIKCNPSAIP